VLSFVLTAGGPGGYEVVIVIVQLAVSAVIFYWFASHGEYFH
jgi:hypothetical protein